MREHLALLGLWSIRGFGAARLRRLEALTPLKDIAEIPCKEWLKSLDPGLPPQVASAFEAHPNLKTMGQAVLEEAQRAHMQVLFRGEEGFPGGLEVLGDVPPLLFAWGYVSPPPAPKVAMVGTRHPAFPFWQTAECFARHMAQEGVLVVSGAAEGVDQICLQAAMEESGRAWAFVGCGLDCLGQAQQRFWEKHMCVGGAYFSEYPPGARADKTTFPRRNRLISAAADVVVILRAPLCSGSLYTARYAIGQHRPLWALAGSGEDNEGCMALLAYGEARLATRPEDILASLPKRGAKAERGGGPPLCPPSTPPYIPHPTGGGTHTPYTTPGLQRATPAAPKAPSRGPLCRKKRGIVPPQRGELAPLVGEGLSDEAHHIWAQLAKATLFEELLAATHMESAALASALCELELLGRVVQKPGKRYERV
ncbi:MAG: DNA-protecting protein DprA [Proteobacteria bacterium]|nr:DNA-protecting protein DprA [Cystobacterineae bacterium]MCL2258811.1 DNA-protecting protein DprA [Cystobacterineae bacterium]MCL2314819.1 DNA-protecting protein DprA [Pseudomonadota bacterium]